MHAIRRLRFSWLRRKAPCVARDKGPAWGRSPRVVSLQTPRGAGTERRREESRQWNRGSVARPEDGVKASMGRWTKKRKRAEGWGRAAWPPQGLR